MNVLPPRNRPDLGPKAEMYRLSQFEAWDMISGRLHPELGGRPDYLDIPGSNFYHSNEWEIEGNGRLRWEDEPRDERWQPYHRMLLELWRRYERPVYIGETSHFGTGRARWIREIGREIELALECGVPLEGVCLYPVIDRYDWQDPAHWHNSGVWDFAHGNPGDFERVLNPDYAPALKEAQARLAALGYV